MAEYLTSAEFARWSERADKQLDEIAKKQETLAIDVALLKDAHQQTRDQKKDIKAGKIAAVASTVSGLFVLVVEWLVHRGSH